MMYAVIFSLGAAGCCISVFIIHWISLLPITDPQHRLEKSRALYLVLSSVLAASAAILYLRPDGELLLTPLIPLGCVFALAGDWFNLQYPAAKKITRGEPVFGGIVSFCLTQICFLAAFKTHAGPVIEAHRLVFLALMLLFLLLPLLVFILRVFRKGMPKRILMGSLVYGSLLGAMAATAVFSALFVRGPWLMIAVGALLYLFSDARMGMTTLHGYHPPNEFQIPWLTYLAGQALILNGFALLSP